MNRSSILAAVFALLSCASWSSAEEKDVFQRLIQPTLQNSCVKCHGKNKKTEGEVNLFELQTESGLKKNPELLDQLIDALEQEEMPPEKEPQLSPQDRKQLVSHLKSMLHEVVRSRNTFSQTPIRRLNRFQYNNAIQDLFQLNVTVFQLPERMMREHGKYFLPETGKMPQTLKVGSRPLGKSQLIEKRLAGVSAYPQDLRAENGFDNRGDHLSLSPLLLESFLNLSRSIVESPDFNKKTCQIWESFFEAPVNNEQIEETVRERLQSFLTRAFRRPVKDEQLARYVDYVTSQIESGVSFTDSMKAAASAVISSPRFLYIYDRASDGEKAEPLDDFELATRLSFFLWGSIPDDELLTLAEAGTLHEPTILKAQVQRMLNDRRLKRFCDSFPSQWLQLERIVSSVPDPKVHPNFYFLRYRTSMHMMLEPLLVFETVLIENRSIAELIDSDFSYRSSLLKAWYQGGSPARGAVTAIPFSRTKITDRRQGGVITTAALMTMTSNPTRTQPITRGAWIATVIFNNPPEPPPADAPPLPEDDHEDVAKDLTIRERLAAHRERAACAGCHAQIDPLGFALENYGPTGLWRDKYANGRDVDSSGTLFRKHTFTNIVEFKDAILVEKDRFARGFTGHLLSFALGRSVSAADSPAIDRIVSETKPANYRLRALIEQIVLSEPFLHKYNPTKDPAHAE